MQDKASNYTHNVTVRLTEDEFNQLNELVEREKAKNPRGIRITQADILRAALNMLYDDRKRDRRGRKTEEQA